MKISVTHSTVKTWWAKYRQAPAASSCINSAKELHEKHGAELQELLPKYGTRYKLCQVLRKREPPLFVSDGIAKVWLEKYAKQEELTTVMNAGHLEMQYGARIRARRPAEVSDGKALSEWLQGNYGELVCKSQRSSM